MMSPFNRRDSRILAALTAVMVAAGMTTILPAAPGFGWREAGLVGAAVAMAMVILGLLLRHLPSDVPLSPVPQDEARQAAAPPGPGQARLRVALRPEQLSWYRIDIELDGVFIGQVRPGTALVQSIPPGLHRVTSRVWLRRLGSAELINALPGTDSDIAIRGWGGSARKYSIERRDLSGLLATGQICVVERTKSPLAATKSNDDRSATKCR